MNGLRQGASGYQGTCTDVSTIPVSAIERIEILPEGIAALYGCDAVGGVVNIILRRNVEGIEARVRGSATDRDSTERSAALFLGHAGSRGNVLAGFQLNDRDALRCSARAYCAANADFRRVGGTDLRGFASNPGTILDPNTRAPNAAIPHGQGGTQLTAAQLIPGAANYTDNVTASAREPFVVAAGVDCSGDLELRRRLSESWLGPGAKSRFLDESRRQCRLPGRRRLRLARPYTNQSRDKQCPRSTSPLRQSVRPDFWRPGVRPGLFQFAGQATQPAVCEALGTLNRRRNSGIFTETGAHLHAEFMQPHTP